MTDASSSSRRSLVSDEQAYILPMAVFLLLTMAAGWSTDSYALLYATKTLLVAALLMAFRRHYTPISWHGWGWGVVVGVIGIVQWVGMEKLLDAYWPGFPRAGGTPFVPTEAIADPILVYAFFAIRILGAVLVVPVMEELFWRDWLWRTIIAPNHFKLAGIGEPDRWAIGVIPIAFAFVHLNWWLTAAIWALLIAGLLVHTRSLGACIIAHAVTNLLLAMYVLWTTEWGFW